MSPDTLSVTVRALALITLFQAVGAVFFMAQFVPRLSAAQNAVRRLAMVAACCAALLTLLHHGLEAARMAGDYSGLWDAQLQQLAWGSRFALAPLAQLTGLLILLLSLWLLPAATPAAGSTAGSTAANSRVSVRTALSCASAGGVMAVCGLLLSGHTSAHAARAVLAPLLGLHLLIAAYWFGALWPLLMVIRLEAAPAAAQLAARYSTIAGYLVPLIAVAGVTMACVLTGEWTVLRRPYGELLLLKLVLFMLLMAPAAYNKWRLVPALGTAPRAAATALRRTIAAELLLIACVLAVTATLTTLYSPQAPEESPALAATAAASP